MVKHLKQSLFDAPEDSIIIHACNAQGVWGSGIAKEFKTRYPESFEWYSDHCKSPKALGEGRLSYLTEEPHKVGWIITSYNYGNKKDSKVSILGNTALALNDLCNSIYLKMSGYNIIEVYSNKFNSGLFGVPWEESEEVLNQVLKRYPKINWIICSLE